MTPCLSPWGEMGECASGHICVRPDGHEGRCRCRCGVTTTQRDPIYDDPMELEEALEALDD